MIGRTARQVVFDITGRQGDINSQETFIAFIKVVCKCSPFSQPYPVIWDAIADIICDKYLPPCSSDYRIKISLSIATAVRLYNVAWLVDNCELLMTHLIKSSQELLAHMKDLDTFAMSEFGNNVICFAHKRL